MSKLNAKVLLSGTQKVVGTGWLPPMPDLRDYSQGHAEINKMTKKLKLSNKAELPPTVDLRKWCSPVEDQGRLGSCTAQAGMGIVEYFQRRAFGKHYDGSRLFLYKTTRNLMGVTGDTGSWLRNTMGALCLCGVPDEKYWPYTDKQGAEPDGFDREPSAFVYAIADNYEAIKYFCHDPMGKNIPPTKVLATVKLFLAAGIPSMFGFFGFPSFGMSDTPGGIPYPSAEESAEWGHAIAAVGYDDDKKIKNTQSGQETTGAFLIRNSWGEGWGDAGYGWLPYEYVLNGLAVDFWSLLSMEWVDTDKFGL
ncbi:Cysteine protease, C1A family [Thiothrix caldifontis]|uniref:Cysteine protease, C1A family n=1 Tax=Thiothrix caldifontis TaxID=525918 RepID=A0A1H3ZM00_9GAMM|nr:C1 family peptidase [Thiothrix caldifontis]SEA24773.1 Cysteine protease, C1A family [Thiothrix caldifontis]